MSGTLEYRGVSFGYPEGKRLAKPGRSANPGYWYVRPAARLRVYLSGIRCT